MGDFAIGLQVTALGMGLVFLTLVIVMLAIMALDRIFRPKAHDTEEAMAPVAPEASPVAAASENDALDEVAAIGAAIAAAIAARESAGYAPRSMRSADPLFALPESEQELPGEVILVATIDEGSNVWGRTGRFQAIR